METAAISYRVADFLKRHPPFHAVDDEDLLQLAQGGKVRFFESNEYILWQGEAYRFHIFVIQQGTVTVWDESGERAELRDVCGGGDIIGIEQFDGGDAYRYSAKAATDVVLYSFPAMDFKAFVLKYQYARQYVAALGNVAAEYQPAEDRREAHGIFLHELVGGKQLPSCESSATIREVARYMLTTGAEAVAVLDSKQRARGVVTSSAILEWIEAGAGDAGQPATKLLRDAAPPAIALNASVAEGVLAMGAAAAGALAITSDGTSKGRLHAIVTHRDLEKVFGDQPVAILSEIERARNLPALRELNQRARAFVFRRLTSAASVEWLCGFTSLIDAGILRRLIAIANAAELPACWCFCGAHGRGESLTGLAPHPILILDDGDHAPRLRDAYRHVMESLAQCGYVPNTSMPFEASFYAAGLADWKQRYLSWIGDPVVQQMYRARLLFDLRPVAGTQSLCQDLETVVTAAANHDFLYILANDCLASLPPLTFFQDAVVDESGEQTAIFRLEHSALAPLVDVGRVFAMAAGKVMGSSTLERFATARRLLPEHGSIFREASDMLRVVLWQQGRIGISQGTNGSELPPALLSRFDRQKLKGGFRSILRLLEFTADPQWLNSL